MAARAARTQLGGRRAAAAAGAVLGNAGAALVGLAAALAAVLGRIGAAWWRELVHGRLRAPAALHGAAHVRQRRLAAVHAIDGGVGWVRLRIVGLSCRGATNLIPPCIPSAPVAPAATAHAGAARPSVGLRRR